MAEKCINTAINMAVYLLKDLKFACVNGKTSVCELL